MLNKPAAGCVFNVVSPKYFELICPLLSVGGVIFPRRRGKSVFKGNHHRLFRLVNKVRRHNLNIELVERILDTAVQVPFTPATNSPGWR